MAARGREAGLICLSSLFLIAVASIILLPPNCKRFHLYDVLSVIWCEMQALLALLQWGLIFFLMGRGWGGTLCVLPLPLWGFGITLMLVWLCPLKFPIASSSCLGGDLSGMRGCTWPCLEWLCTPPGGQKGWDQGEGSVLPVPRRMGVRRCWGMLRAQLGNTPGLTALGHPSCLGLCTSFMKGE